MLFGNWIVTDDSISWYGKGLQRFVIASAEMNQKVVDKDMGELYTWILRATEEDWLTQNDLYDLNYAFVYAIGKFNVEFTFDIFDATLALQYERFEAEDDEDVET